ncbi:PIN domain-like protein [Piedraia hortae CBS 480.64]|uniref:PIN domain-like protein n=1 Tax=Piedraia hortae CBS 480.64 TaxID=1314780 RepID=A0A6A7C7M3_9PEZI|nr:PIN domain-like protein [Piedraia hortae CBS 480.64]
MGVTGLWQVVQPCARPIKLDSLNRKKLAIDASIWIYHFLKAVRDKEGNALRSSHVVGFFRRICKLLYYGIQPVFVFDGAAPALKRQTINARKQRREGRREDAARTAGRLLAMQMQRHAEEVEAERRNARDGQPEEDIPDEENLVYAEELHMTQEERQKNRKFKKTDAYHLPELEVSLAEMSGPDDLRVMSLAELEEYALQFNSGEDINVYDFGKIDYDSPFFMSLPASDRYNILNAARLRSRLRMGHSKEQLDQMFPDRMAFSKFQIERVRERNELTTRLMNINAGDVAYGMSANRIAGEKSREYVLVKNDGVEGGWALGVLVNDEGSKEEKAIDVDKSSLPEITGSSEEEEEDIEFEDVPIEGLNRLPKRRKLSDGNEGRAEETSLFGDGEGDTAAQEDMGDPDSLFLPSNKDEVAEDEGMQREIAMSLEQASNESDEDGKSEDDSKSVIEFEQHAVAEPRPVSSGSAAAIATPLPAKQSEEDAVDLQQALTKKRKAPSPPSVRQKSAAKPLPSAGPLPFEKLDLGSSLLGKKMDRVETYREGGFEQIPAEKKKAEPLPPWFSDTPDQDMNWPGAAEEEKPKETESSFIFQDRDAPLQRQPEVIDLDADLPPDEVAEERSITEETRPAQHIRKSPRPTRNEDDDEEQIEWSSSESAKSPSPALEFEPVKLSPPEETNLNPEPVPDGPMVEQPQSPSSSTSSGPLSPTASEAELLQALAAENTEHERFAASLNPQIPTQPITREALMTDLKASNRDSSAVTQTMITECQTLLSLFGLPYITAPSEAESQCSTLQSLGLVDGIITDDSDIFLFGGNRVYKNFFNSAKFVESYLLQDLEKEYDLTRERLIALAQLLGSDYAEGIKGVGPVTGMEILKEFHGDLEEFKTWVEELQFGTAPRAEDNVSATRKKLRRAAANKFILPTHFPDARVEDAYLNPNVDKSLEQFVWGVPNLDGLRGFLMETVGWDQARTDEVLVPVLAAFLNLLLWYKFEHKHHEHFIRFSVS